MCSRQNWVGTTARKWMSCTSCRCGAESFKYHAGTQASGQAMLQSFLLPCGSMLNMYGEGNGYKATCSESCAAVMAPEFAHRLTHAGLWGHAE